MRTYLIVKFMARQPTTVLARMSYFRRQNFTTKIRHSDRAHGKVSTWQRQCVRRSVHPTTTHQWGNSVGVIQHRVRVNIKHIHTHTFLSGHLATAHYLLTVQQHFMRHFISSVRPIEYQLEAISLAAPSAFRCRINMPVDLPFPKKKSHRFA